MRRIPQNRHEIKIKVYCDWWLLSLNRQCCIHSVNFTLSIKETHYNFVKFISFLYFKKTIGFHQNFKMDKKIIIIGAGASGVAAATKLISNGFKNITILEGENRLGGRVNTIPFGANIVDMGGQWFVMI